MSLAAGVTATYDNKNAGTNKKVTYSNLALTGDKAKNYNLANAATGNGTIEKANVTISVEDYSRAYDGTTSATGAALKTVTGQIFTGDTVSGGTFAFADKNAGTGSGFSWGRCFEENAARLIAPPFSVRLSVLLSVAATLVVGVWPDFLARATNFASEMFMR